VCEQFRVGEVRAGQFEGFGEVYLVQVDGRPACGAGFVGFQLPERLRGLVILRRPRRIVIRQGVYLTRLGVQPAEP
jgi:hypothetical protein